MKGIGIGNGKTLHYIIKSIVSVLSICIIIILAGCTKAPPASPSEEIRLHDWVMTDDKGMKDKPTGSLSFGENTLTLRSERGESELLLTGECIIDDKSITVITEDFGTVVMEYALSSEKLTVSYFGKSATFVKENALRR